MLWQILIASVYERTGMLAELLERRLVPHLSDQVQVLVLRDGGGLEIGAKRTRLVQAASASYVCFVDDDDDVRDNYVPRIVEALDSSPDYVGFDLVYEVDGVAQKPVFHDPACGGWYETPRAFWRDISHLNPIRRQIAVACLPFEGGFGEDQRWVDRVRGSGLIRSHVYLGGVPVYVYRYSTSGSLFRHGPDRSAARVPAPVLPGVTYLEESA